jgi:uncharacterized protein (TIGR02246 family)
MTCRMELIFSRRPSPVARVIAISFIIAVSLTGVACSSQKQQPGQPAAATPADLEAINQLHERDVEASKSLDVEALASLWTDDIVSIPQDGKPIIGKEANRNSLLKLREAMQDLDIVEYNISFNEVKVTGDWAFEWGTFSGAVKPKAGGEAMHSSGNLLRVLKREADGSWKVARTMSSNDSPYEEDGRAPE